MLISLPLIIALFLSGLVPPQSEVTYEVYAIRFGTLPQFRVSGLVAGADAERRLDIPVMVWLLKGSDGKRVLIDSGFYRQKFIDQWKPQNFRSPADAVAAAGVKPEEITDIIISHAHWDHVGGADLFPKATVWIQRDEYRYYTGEAWHARNTHGGVDPEDMVGAAADQHRRAPALRQRRRSGGPARDSLLHRRPPHPCVAVRRRADGGGTAVFTSDNMYLYENLEKRAPIAQTLDAASNLAAQDRIRGLASDVSLIVPGHDPAVFERYNRVAEGIVRIK